MAAAEKENDNMRRHTRRRTLFGGVIYMADGTERECSISDISKSGARIRLDGDLEIGNKVEIKINKHGIFLHSTVMWFREGYYGVEFRINLDTEDESVKRFFSLIQK